MITNSSRTRPGSGSRPCKRYSGATVLRDRCDSYRVFNTGRARKSDWRPYIWSRARNTMTGSDGGTSAGISSRAEIVCGVRECKRNRTSNGRVSNVYNRNLEDLSIAFSWSASTESSNLNRRRNVCRVPNESNSICIDQSGTCYDYHNQKKCGDEKRQSPLLPQGQDRAMQISQRRIRCSRLFMYALETQSANSWSTSNFFLMNYRHFWRTI